MEICDIPIKEYVERMTNEIKEDMDLSKFTVGDLVGLCVQLVKEYHRSIERQLDAYEKCDLMLKNFNL